MVNVKVLDFKAVEPRSRVNQTSRVRIPHFPNRLRLASILLRTSQKGHEELNSTVGVRGITGISQIIFRVFRDGKQIFKTQQGVESAGSEQTYTIAFQAIDLHPKNGSHRYTLTVENITSGTTAAVVGPVSFSGLSTKRKTHQK